MLIGPDEAGAVQEGSVLSIDLAGFKESQGGNRSLKEIHFNFNEDGSSCVGAFSSGPFKLLSIAERFHIGASQSFFH